MSRIALFGGAFDPPHVGHQAVTLHLLSQHPVDEVWWLPSAVHAFGKHMVDFEHRCEMCRLALAPFDPSRVRLCTVEADLPAPQHSIDTLRHLQQRHPELRFDLAIGSDNLDAFDRWKEAATLRQMVELRVIPRAGHDPAATLPNISSSQLRQALARQKTPPTALDRQVALYIQAHGLYKGAR